MDPALGQARRQALADVKASLSPAAQLPSPSIPLKASDWIEALEDSGIRVAFDEALASTRALLATARYTDGERIGSAMRRAAAAAVAAQRRLEVAAERVAWFEPPEQCRLHREAVVRGLASTRAALLSVFEVLEADDALGDSATASLAVADAQRSALEIQVALGNEDEGLALLGGEPVARFVGGRGVVETSRIFAFLHDRPQELRDRCRELIRGLDPTRNPPLLLPPRFPLALALSSRPLVAHEVARGTVAIVRDTWAKDSDRVIEEYERAADIAVFGANTHFTGIAPTSARMRAGLPPAERARAAIELYRTATEGPFRQSAWRLLRLRGAVGGAPVLAELRDRLTADGSATALLIVQGLEVAWRNAGAHEEHYWDPAAARVVMANGNRVTVDELIDASRFALAVMEGVEVGLIYARADIPDLATRLSQREPSRIPAYLEVDLRDALGRNGVWVWDTEWEGTSTLVVVDSMEGMSGLFTTLAALQQAHVDVPEISRFTVRVRSDGNQFRLDRSAFTAADPLLPVDDGAGKLDPNVVLPLVAAYLIDNGISEEDAGREVARMGIRSPILKGWRSASQIVAGSPEASFALSATLALADRAIEASWTIAAADPNFRRTIRAQIRAALDAAIAVSGGQAGSGHTLRRRMNDLRDMYLSLPQDPRLRDEDR